MIVLIDDNKDEQEIILAALRKLALVVPVEVFSSGEPALEFLARSSRDATRKRPWLVLLDLKIPPLDGFEVLRRLRGEPRTATVPVVVFTSSRERRDVETCYRLGANSYVCKPVDFASMVDLMRTLVGYWLRVNESTP